MQKIVHNVEIPLFTGEKVAPPLPPLIQKRNYSPREHKKTSLTSKWDVMRYNMKFKINAVQIKGHCATYSKA